MFPMYASHSDQQVFQLQQLAPEAWTNLLQANFTADNITVSNVQKKDVGGQKARYTLTLEGYSDPVTLFGRKTTRREAYFYNSVAAEIDIAPHCWFSHVGSKSGWAVMSDTAHDLPPGEWDKETTLEIVRDLARFHATHWGAKKALMRNTWLPFMLGHRRRKSARAFSEMPTEWDRSIVSEHALRSVEGLATRWLEAAYGLRMLLDLDGWQNVIEEKHLRAMADLIDDPLPMLHALRELPQTLIHGYPGIYNWQVSVFDTRLLLDWQQVSIGPGITDLVTFIESFGLLQNNQMNWYVRDQWPVSEETMIDSYILQLSADLGGDAQTYAVRGAIPAARCLHILLTWLPRFNQWFANLPEDLVARREMWEAINTIDHRTAASEVYDPIAGLRPYLAEVFDRFLRAYYQLIN